MSDWMIAYWAGLALCIAVLAWVMRRGEWTWMGLYVAVGIMFCAMAKHIVWLRMVLDPDYRVAAPNVAQLFVWPDSLPWGLLVGFIGVVELYAMIGAVRRPTLLATAALFPVSIYQLTMTAWGIHSWIMVGEAPLLHVGDLALPAWIGVPLYLGAFDVPLVCAIPFAVQRLIRSDNSAAGKILNRFSLSLGIILVAFAVLIAAVFSATLRTSRMAGSGSTTSQEFVGIALFALLVLLILAVVDFRRTFLLPALTLVENAGQDRKLADLHDLASVWKPLAQIVDDSRQKANERREQLIATQDALHQSEKLAALGQLLAGVAHELNNPLSAVLGQTALLSEDLEGSHHSARIGKIKRAAERCSRIVQSFLAMARRKAPDPVPTDMNDLVRLALDLSEYQLRTAGIAVACDMASGLPPAQADADQIHQVIVNLLSNARQALEAIDGERRIALATGFDRATGMVTLSVADNGPGIPADLRGRIFDPFFTTKPEGHGTGIGLAFSSGIAESHGGALRLDDVREGTRFILSLPCADKIDSETASEVEQRHRGKGRVLIVDDEDAVAETLDDIFQRLGYATKVALSGEAAIAAMAGGESFDLVLSDLRMPGVDGPALHAWIAEHRPELLDRLAFVTGDTLGGRAAEFVAESGCSHVEKPFTRASLTELVEKVAAR